MKRVVLIALFIVITLISCTQSGSKNELSVNNSDNSMKIGISMPTKSLERWNKDAEYFRKEFESKGYDVDIVFSDNKISQQINDIESLLASDIDLLIVNPIDGESLSQVLKDAKDKNIPVISYDRLIMNTDAISYYISFDNYSVGKLMGEFIDKKLDLANSDDTYNIEFTSGDPADNNALYFFDGAMDVLKPYMESGKLKTPSGQVTFQESATQNWSTSVAMNRMQNILASYYLSGNILDVALCFNDATALGVSRAIESDYVGDNSVIITGQDGDEINLQNIIDGKQTMTVYKAMSNEVVVAVSVAEKLLKGETPNENLIKESNWNFDCIYDTTTYNNGIEYVPSYLLIPVAVTRDNLEKELIDTGFYRMENGYPKSN